MSLGETSIVHCTCMDQSEQCRDEWLGSQSNHWAVRYCITVLLYHCIIVFAFFQQLNSISFDCIIQELKTQQKHNDAAGSSLPFFAEVVKG